MSWGWMSQLLYEWQKFMNSTYPFLFSDPWLSYIFQQPWKVSNNCSMVNVYTTPSWMCIYHCLIHIQDHCEWSQDIPSHITLTPFLNQWHSSIFMSYISSYNKYIVFSCWSWSLGNWMIHWNKMEIHQTKNLNKAVSTPYRLRVTFKFTTPMDRIYSCPNLGIYSGVYQVYGASWAWISMTSQLQCRVTMAWMNTYRVLDISASTLFIVSGEHKAQGRIWSV